MVRRIAILLGVFGAVLLAAVGAGPAVGSGGRAIPDVQKLFRSAVAQVRAADHGVFARAVVFEADGSTRGGGLVHGAAGVLSWQFVLDNPTPNSPYAYATIPYGPSPKGFGAVAGHHLPYLEDVPITRAPVVSLASAVILLQRAGYRGGFSSVTMRNPLGPKATDAYYFFGTRHGYVTVDVVTGKVARAA
jgi:hypothetical protein